MTFIAVKYLPDRQFLATAYEIASDTQTQIGGFQSLTAALQGRVLAISPWRYPAHSSGCLGDLPVTAVTY